MTALVLSVARGSRTYPFKFVLDLQPTCLFVQHHPRTLSFSCTAIASFRMTFHDSAGAQRCTRIENLSVQVCFGFAANLPLRPTSSSYPLILMHGNSIIQDDIS